MTWNDALNETADRAPILLRSSLNCRDTRNVMRPAAGLDTLHITTMDRPIDRAQYFELNARMAWNASQKLELSLDGQNLRYNRHPEYGFHDPARGRVSEVSRKACVAVMNKTVRA